MNCFDGVSFSVNNFSPDVHETDRAFLSVFGSTAPSLEEMEVFYKQKDSFKFSDSHFYNPHEHNDFQKYFPDVSSYFNYILKNHPELIKMAFNIRKEGGNLVFPKFADLFHFLIAPVSQYHNTMKYNIKLKEKVIVFNFDLEKNLMNDANIRQLNHLADLCKTSNSNDLGLYLIALKNFSVDLMKLHKIGTKYPIEVYLKLEVSRSLVPSKPNALILTCLPNADHNGSFNFINSKSFLLGLAKDFNLRLRVIDKVDKISQVLKEEKDINLLVLSAHGDRECIVFSEESDFEGILYKRNVKKIDFSPLDPDAIIFLKSCETGNTEGDKPPIAQRIANVADRKVFAPQKVLADTLFRYHEGKFSLYETDNKLEVFQKNES